MTEELKQAISALQCAKRGHCDHAMADEAIAALEALTQRPAAQAGEREAFEKWYAEDANKQTGKPGWFTPEEIANLRDGDEYGEHRVMLNGKWRGWQARAPLPTQPAAQATPEPSHGMIGMGAHALANELAQAVAQDDADPDGHDMSAGLFGPNVSAWLRKISAEYLSQPATPEPVLSIELIRLADIIRDCGRLVSKSGNAERIMRDAARVLATPEPVPNKRECPHCNYTGSAHCGDVADKLKASGGDPKDCSNAKVYGLRADAQVIALTALLNDPAVIEAAQPGDIGRAFMATREDL